MLDSFSSEVQRKVVPRTDKSCQVALSLSLSLHSQSISVFVSFVNVPFRPVKQTL